MSEKENDKQCVVCQSEGVDFTRVEVSNDGVHYTWFSVCGEKCLQQIIRGWKQVSEIIRPGEGL